MKKLISLIAATCILCTMLTGCKTEVIKIGGDEGGTLKSPLVVWLVGIPSGRFSLPLNFFKSNYPNIPIEIVEKHTETKEITKQTFQDIGKEIENGADCDVIIAASEFFQYCDMYKLQKSDSFMDLTSAMETDESFNIEEYNEAVIGGAVYDGAQYMMPISYTMPMFYSTAQNLDLDKTGIDPSNFRNSNAILSGFKQYYAGYGESTPAPLFQYPDRYMYAHNFMGIGTIDHQSEIVNLNSVEYKKSMELWKAAYFNETENTANTRLYNIVDCMSTLENNKSVTVFDFSGYDLHFSMIKGMIQGEKDYLYFPWRDTNGDIRAEIRSAAMVSSKAKNPEAAWTFIKSILSEETQEKLFNDKFGWWGTGVNKAAFESSFLLYEEDWRIRQGVGSVTLQAYERMFANCEDNWAERYFEGALPFDQTVPRTELDSYRALQEQISGVFMRSPVDELLYTSMQEYFLYGKDYDECVKAAEEAITEYWS